MKGLLPRLPRPAWVVLGADAVSAIGSGMTLPFLVIYLHSVRGIDLELAGLALAAIPLASFVGNPVGGALADRVGARNTLVSGLVIEAIGTLAIIPVREAWHGVAAAAVVGLGASIVWPAQDSLLASIVEPEHRSNAFGVRHATMNAGLAGGALLAAVIVESGRVGSFQLVYLFDAVSFLLIIPALLAVPALGARHAVSDAANERGSYRTVFADRAFARLWLLMALLVLIGYGAFNAALPILATEFGGLSSSSLGIVFAANTITVVVAQLVVLRIAAGHRRTTAVILLAGCWALTWTVVLVAGHAGGGTAGLVLYSLAAAVFALGETLLAPTLPAIANDLASDAQRGRYNGAFTLAWTTGFFAGPLVASVALGSRRDELLLIGLVLGCAIAAGGAARLHRHLPSGIDIIGAPA